MPAQTAGKTGGILVYSEDAEIAAELLGAARTLAGPTGMALASAAIGPNIAALADDCLARGADEVITVRTADAPLDSEALAAALQAVVQALQPAVLLLGATRSGLELAARLAQKLNIACASNCTTLRWDTNGDLLIEKRVYGGRFVASQRLRALPRMATVQPKRFAKAERQPAAQGKLREISVALPPARVRLVGVQPRARSQVDVTRAEVIVAAGRGVKRVEDLQLLDRLAAVLGGVVAGTRPLTGDLDWLPTDRRIGLSGQTVKPNLYIACGVSGQIEHIVGMKGARTVVAINNDPKAPIHAEADYSIIGDLYEVVPALINACEQRRQP
ncbi:MAG: electron transfer flavoprotein subunit alpha/FixB family protein [Gammaproteobacteria bacterium]